ncbi:MAG: hypothetical protein GX882_04585 [Methanomicrobiales archaeon]|nr:hypothetical protein [Methanomicrobiales archaeon]
MNSQSYPWIIAVVAILIAVAIGISAMNQPAALPATGTTGDARELLVHLQSDITVALEAVDSRLSHVASDLGGISLNGTAARGLLLNLSMSDPAIVDCVIVDAEGTIIAAEPAAYHGAEGSDISGQEHVQRILATKRPVMSEMIAVVEGFPAVVIAAPIFTDESRFAGFAADVVRPEVLIRGVAGPAANGTPYQVMVVQTDGRVLYDTDTAQIGWMTFEDPLYADSPELQDAARRVVAERYGTAAYRFAADGGEAVQKAITWTTAGLHGTEWRVAVIQAVE